MRRLGFTIVELAAVLATIAVLAAILFPVFSRAREASRSASCKANLLNIFVALRIYASDFEALPPGLGGPLVLCDLGLVQRRTLECPSHGTGPLFPAAEDQEGGEPSYIYVPGRSWAGGHRLLVADARDRHNDMANILMADGSLAAASAGRWMELVPRDVGAAAGIFGVPPAGGGRR